MIVKNEEAVLPRCLKSVSSLVDEIIFVDTGSTDSTIETAQSFGAKVFNYAWDQSFCNARNFSLSKATSDWILVLDADEVLKYNSKEQFDRLLEDKSAEGYFIRVINLLGSPPDTETSEDIVVRLFRNKPQYRFSGVIHEQVRPSIAEHAGEETLKNSSCTIYHDGYLSKVIAEKNKIHRNIEVIIKALAESPSDPFLLYSLGCEYFITDDFEKSLDVFQQALVTIPNGEGYLPDLVIKTGLCLYKLGQVTEMRRLMEHYQNHSPLSPELLFLSGLAHLDKGSLLEAEQDFQKCMDGLPLMPFSPLTIRKYQIYQALGEIHEARNNWNKAVQFYFLAVQAKPNYLYPLQKLIAIFKSRKTGLDINEFLAVCPPEPKFTLLSKLNWDSEIDTVLFLILSLLQDVMLSDGEITQILIPRLFTILDRQKELFNLRLKVPVFLSKALLHLTPYKSMEQGDSTEKCRKMMGIITNILLCKEV
jgi:glycosyltransferase involved in cell wall biosynthesis